MAILKVMGRVKPRDLVLECPDSAAPYLALSSHFAASGQSAHECRAAQVALWQEPSDRLAHVLLGQALMRADRYREGLDWFDQRIALSPGNGVYPTEIRRFAGDASDDPALVRLLLIAEMGRGDMLQFCRYAPRLRRAGRSVVAVVPPDLVALFSASELCDHVTSRLDDVQPHRDRWLPMAALLQIAGASRLDPKISGVYLRAPAHLRELWSRRLAAERSPAGPLIALNWAAQRWSQERDRPESRHLPLQALMPLATLAGARFCSVQKGPSQGLWRQLPWADRFVTCQPAIDAETDFAVTAAILEQVDACLTVDTAVAHLAGGLGISTWILLNAAPCWRWGVVPPGPGPSYWYDTARLIRARTPGAWGETVDWFVRELRSCNRRGTSVR